MLIGFRCHIGMASMESIFGMVSMESVLYSITGCILMAHEDSGVYIYCIIFDSY
jgi:hypothetical protein